MVDDIGSDALGEQPYKVGDDQAGHLEAGKQEPSQYHADDLFREDQDGFEPGFVRTQVGRYRPPRMGTGQHPRW